MITDSYNYYYNYAWPYYGDQNYNNDWLLWAVKQNKERLDADEEKIAALETKVDGDNAALESAVTEINERLTDAETTISAHTSHLDSLDSETVRLSNGQVSLLQAITNAQNSISSQGQTIQDQGLRITHLEALPLDVSSMFTAINDCSINLKAYKYGRVVTVSGQADKGSESSTTSKFMEVAESLKPLNNFSFMASNANGLIVDTYYASGDRSFNFKSTSGFRFIFFSFSYITAT